MTLKLKSRIATAALVLVVIDVLATVLVMADIAKALR
jgi:hypothetical protein